MPSKVDKFLGRLREDDTGQNIRVYPTINDFPVPGKEGIIYIAADSDKIYIWDPTGAQYIEQTNFVPVIDNLTSTSATAALSANQGRVLNEKVEARYEKMETVLFIRNEGLTPIQDAIDGITDASPSKLYVLVLDAGNFAETVTLNKPHIFLTAFGHQVTTVDTFNLSFTSASFEIFTASNINFTNVNLTLEDNTQFKLARFQNILIGNFTASGESSSNHIVRIKSSYTISNVAISGSMFLATEHTSVNGATISDNTIWQHGSAELNGTFTLEDNAQVFVRNGAVLAFPQTVSATFIAPSGTILNIDGMTASTSDLTQVADDALQLQDAFSAGVITPKGTVTKNIDGTLTITGFPVNLYNNANQVGKPRRYDITGVTDQVLSDNSNNYVLVDFNAGSPQLRFETSDISNASSIKLIAQYYRRGTELHGYELNTEGEGLADKLNEKDKDISYFDRASGIILGETATRVATISAGKLYIGASPLSLTSFASNADTWDFYANVAGTYTLNPAGATTQYNSTQYDDGTDLQTAIPNRYLNNFVYRDADDDSHAFYVLGSDQYLTVNLALEAPIPSSLPDIITNNTVYVGRIIVQQGAAIASFITSPFVDTEATSGVTIHNELASIQGGDTDEYYHLDQADYGALTNLNAQLTNLHTNGNPTFASISVLNSVVIDGPFVFRKDGSAVAARGEVWSNATANAAIIRMVRYRGSMATPLAVLSGDNLGEFRFEGYDGSVTGRHATFGATTTEDWTPSERGTRIDYSVTPNGSNTLLRSICFDHNLNLVLVQNAGIADAATLKFEEKDTTPANPATGTEGKMYVKSDKLVVQFNDAGTIRYKYLALNGTGVTWVHTTTPP